MSFVIAIIIACISSYLTFTDFLARELAAVLPTAQPHVALTAGETVPFTKVASEYVEIPQILIDHAPDQRAAAIGATDTNVYADDPIDALVNIYCVYTRDGQRRATTGSGFFIDSDGIILTNAHVAQFLLLEGIYGTTDCIIRTGNPATPSYEVSLLYISPAWIMKHAALITESAPKGTGERDYAYLYVIDGLNKQPIPRHFKALRVRTDSIPATARGLRVAALGYPAETRFAAGDASAELVPAEAPTSITELMTFDTNTADIFSIAGSAVGEQGASGGPIIDGDGRAIGLISTRGDDEQFGRGSLRALTLSYIARTYEEETGVSFAQGLGGDLPYRARLFKETLTPILQLMLKQELDRAE